MRGFRPWARQVPKREVRVILASVPWFERVPPLILRLITRGRRLRSAAVVVRGHFRLGHEDEEFLDLVNAPAHLALDRQRVVQAGTAEGQPPRPVGRHAVVFPIPCTASLGQLRE